METHIIACTSDTHCGSTVGLCPPETIPLDDGGAYLPSDAQRWLWSCWTRFWDRVGELRDERGAHLTWIHNGDAVEGDHHGSPQMPSNLSLTHSAIFREAARVPLDVGPDTIIAVRGTETHVGKSGQAEEGIFRGIEAEGHPVMRDPARDTCSWWHFRGRFAGRLIDATHHGRMGRLPRTRGSQSRLNALTIFDEHIHDGHEPPELCIRSHLHRYADSGPPWTAGMRLRLVNTPAYQLMTAFGHKVVADSLADIGGVIAVVSEEGQIEVHPVIYKPERTAVEVA